MSVTTKKPTRPVLRYHGGKWLLAPWVINHFPPHRMYVEPFGGAGSVLLQKARCYAEVYNDLDGEVVNLFTVLRDPIKAELLSRLVTLTPFARYEFEKSYESALEPIEQARRTLLRSYAGFGSVAASGRKTGFRSNITRSGTTPAIDWMRFPACIKDFVERLQGVVIENRPADQVITQFDSPETLFYIDPPYPMSVRNVTAKWDKIYRHEMSDDDHRYLSKQLHETAGMVIISGYACDLYDKECFSNWARVERHHLADGGRSRVEVLWINDLAASRLKNRQIQMFSE